MRNVLDLANLPTVVNNVHQSVFRDSQLLGYVLELLEAGTPAEVVISLANSIRSAVARSVNLSDLGEGK